MKSIKAIVASRAWFRYSNKVKLFNSMRFVSIPQNGASWSKKLIYSFDTELDERADVDIEIFNQTTHQLIARKRMHGVTCAEVDIAPMLRSAIEMRVSDPASTIVLSSPMGCKVAVGIMGLMSAERYFCATDMGVLQPQMMSYVPPCQTIGYGEKLMFSVLAPGGMTIKIVEHTATSKRNMSLVPDANTLFYDVVICSASLRGDVERIEVSVVCGSELLAHFDCNIEPRLPAGRRLVWRNRRGGIESYLFAKSVPIMAQANVDTFSTTVGIMSKLRSTTQRDRLCSALECGEALQTLRGIIYAPYIYEMTIDGLQDVALATRCIEYGGHDKLQSVALELVSAWRGGGL